MYKFSSISILTPFILLSLLFLTLHVKAQPCNVQNCLQCQFPNCTKCALGYTIEQNVCRNCTTLIPNCYLCESPSVCTYCTSVHGVKDQVCEPCQDLHCLGCGWDYSVCLECWAGFRLQAGTCHRICIDTNCVQCTNQTDLCTQCAELYSSFIGICFFCNISNCLSCQINSICHTCQPTFSLTFFGECIACNIPNCQKCNQPNICAQCSPSYNMTSNSSCIICTVENCQYCFTNLTCQRCLNGLSVSRNGSHCVRCQAQRCLSCDQQNVCVQCKSGFELGGQGCYLCRGQGCSVCSSDNVCSQCLPNYKLSSNICIAQSPSPSPSTQPNSPQIIIIVCTIVGAVLLITLIVLISCYIIRKRRVQFSASQDNLRVYDKSKDITATKEDLQIERFCQERVDVVGAQNVEGNPKAMNMGQTIETRIEKDPHMQPNLKASESRLREEQQSIE